MSGQITDQNAGLGLGVVQPQSGLDYPFVSPGIGFHSEFLTDVRYLFADFYLSFDDKGYYQKDYPYARHPLRLYWLYGFGTAPAWSFGGQPLAVLPTPAPTHSADLVVVDSNNRVVFDTTTADYFTETNWGDPKIIDGRESYHYKIYEWRKTTKPGETVCRAIKYESLHPNYLPLHERPVEFCPRQAVLDERTIERIPRRVLAMRVQNGECVTPWFKNRVTLVNGYNTGLTMNPTRTQNLRRTTEIGIKAISGIGRGQYGLCATTPCVDEEPTNVCPPGEDPEVEACYDGPGEKILTINGAVPDGNGNIQINASGCLWFRKPVHYSTPNTAHNYARVLTPECCVTPNPPTPIFSDSGVELTNVLNVGADCPPCCACDDYLQVARYIRDTANKYKTIGDRAREVKLLHEQNIGRWADQLACRQKEPLKIILVQQPCPCIDVFVSYCNQCDDCKRNVRLNVAMSGAESASAITIDPKFVQLSGSADSAPPTLSGGWPAFVLEFPAVNARSSVSAKFRMCFCPRYAHQLQGRLTGTYTEGPILAGCDPDASEAVAIANVVVDCGPPPPPPPPPPLPETNQTELVVWGQNYMGLYGNGTDTTPLQYEYVVVGQPGEWYDFSLGYNHMLAIKKDGTLWAWGDNYYGQIGNGYFGGEEEEVQAPTQIGVGIEWEKISAGSKTSAAISRDGELWLWGLTAYLGFGFNPDAPDTPEHTPTPTKLTTPERKWKDVVCAGTVTYALTDAGELYAWGDNEYGGVGDGTTINRWAPVKITEVQDAENVFRINETWASLLRYGPAAIAENGSVYRWGSFARLDSESDDPNIEHQIVYDTITRPTRLNNLDAVVNPAQNRHVRYAFITAGGGAIINTAGELWVWGSNFHYELGLNDPVMPTPEFPEVVWRDNPVRITEPAVEWKYAFIRGPESFAIDVNDRLYGFGDNWQRLIKLNESYEYGDSIIPAPTLIEPAQKWRKVQLGGGTFAAAFRGLDIDPVEAALYRPVAKNGASLFVWGYGLTENAFDASIDPTAPPPGEQYGGVNQWYDFAAGESHILGIKTDRTLWAWGLNSPALGLGSSAGGADYITQPLQIGAAKNWAKVSAGHSHSAAIDNAGDLWLWGANGLGQLGDGTTTARGMPTRVMSDKKWKDVFCIGNTTYAISTNYELYAWGENSSGQVGDGTVNGPTIPKEPTKITTVTVNDIPRENTRWYFVAGGRGVAYAVGDNGAIFAWGVNLRGSVAAPSSFNDLTYVTRPRQIDELNQIVNPSQNKFVRSIAGANRHAVVVNTTNELWTWGDNHDGQLGLNIDASTLAYTSTPTKVLAPENGWLYASASGETASGRNFVLGLDNNLWGFGANYFKTLKSDGPAQLTTPTLRANEEPWVKVLLSGGGNAWAAGLRVD